MKRYGNLYQQVYDLENIRQAHKNARQGKGHYREVKRIEREPERHFRQIHFMLKNKTFQNSDYSIFQKVNNNKLRTIYRLPYFPDRIIHHCIMQVVENIWTKTLIAGTYACIKGRGIHKAAKHIKSALRDKKGAQYCLKCDVRKFYPSVDHDILKAAVRRKIKDPDLLWLLDQIIDSVPGVPIGNYLSQHFGNLYLSGFDHWIKEEMRCKHYFRYCDDLVVLHHDKRFLHQLRAAMQAYLAKHLRLALKQDWQVYPVDARGVDFLGYRFFHDYTLLRKNIALRFKRKMRRLKKNYRRLEPVQVLSSVMSYYGWMKHANCLNLMSRHIDEDMMALIEDICRRNNLRNPAVRAPGLATLK